jgi:NAD(P)-dependent dehydrogenase (short-subunit alcohol dehydrogenase family)
VNLPGEFSVDLTGFSVLVTGGTRGIGRALVDGLAAAGAAVTIGARHGDECTRVAGEITERGGSALGVPLHLADAQSVRDAVDAAAARFGGLDVVINNAATGLAEPVGQFTEDAWDKSMAVNLRGPIMLVQHALPHLRASTWPSVINVISAGAFVAAPDWSIYAAAKAGLLSFTRSLAAALGPEGIRVNALCPGPVDTAMFASNPPEVRRRIASETALQRVAAPSELVGPSLFLISRAASYVSGEVLYVTGGSSGR